MKSNNNIEYYFKSIKNIPLLTAQQEIDLAKKIELGDQKAKKKMIESNLRLAISIAKKYAKYNASFEDLIQECNLGLIKAIEKFDWRRGYKFSTYGCWWIKQAATRYITKNNSVLNIPSHTLGLSRKVNNVIKEYQEEFNEDPTNEEIAEYLNVPLKQIKEALNCLKARYCLSIDKPVSDDNSKTIGDIIPDHGISPEQFLQNKETRKSIIQAFQCLTKREELVLRLRFGLSDAIDNNEFIYEINEEKEKN